MRERTGLSVVGVVSAAVCAWLVVSVGAALGQGTEAAAKREQADAELEAYLEHVGLGELRAEMLLARIERSGREQRVALAERLSRLYVELLSKARSHEERGKWESLSQELLRSVPEADGFELRLNLAKAIYLRAEEGAERYRLRLHSPEEVAQAEASLKSLEPQFREIAARLHRRVEVLERQEESGAETEAVRTELAEARRLRSLAFYYSGWCNYYIAMLTGTQPPALEALKSFGWLLNNPNNRPALLEKVTPNLFRYEHIARAGMGAGLSAGLRGSDVEAIRWLDALESVEELPQAVRDQVFSRRMIVLAHARRWADLERMVRRARNSDRAGGGEDVRPLGLWDARLLAVLTLEADKRVSAAVTESLSRIALGDLVSAGEVAHVMDLVDRFGTTPMGDSGFIVNFVRAVRAYERARALHQESGDATDEPTVRPGVANAYREAAGLFVATDSQPDAVDFPNDRARARMMHGRSLYFSGNMVGAADAFHSAFTAFGEGSAGAEEALWLAVLSLDRAVQGLGAGRIGADEATREKRDQLAAVYLQTFPDSPRAGRLLLMRIASGLVSEEESLRVLSSVAADSPVYPAARRQLARIQYERMRAARAAPGASAAEREIAALRFAEAADEAIAVERRELGAELGTPRAKGIAERIVVLGRQMLDALLGLGSPDGARAQAVLDGLTSVAESHEINLGPLDAELTYRRLQIRLAVNDEAGAVVYADALAEMSGGMSLGEYIDASSRLIFRRVAQRWRSMEDVGARSLEDAILLVRFGVRILDRIRDPARAMADPAVLGAYGVVAEAAAALWRGTGDQSQRDLALRLDEQILKVYPRAVESLVRVADLAESAGDLRRSAECWNARFALAQTGTDAWFEARYNVIRLLERVDRPRAVEQMRQYRLLYPEMGPEPWGSMFRELDGRLATPVGAAGGGTEGGAG